MEFRPLIISDIHHFSTKDIYTGYVSAFQKLGVELDTLQYYEPVKWYSLEHAQCLMLGKMLNKLNNYTHVFFIAGMAIPEWIFRSKRDLKIGVIASDDPHATNYFLPFMDEIDYYFTNEKKIENEFNNSYYVPTATSSQLPYISKEQLPEQYKNDIVFIGTLYDDRIKPLEKICKYCEQNNLSIKIIGPLLKTPEDSIIRKYAIGGIIQNNETKLLYRGAKVVLNIDRNVHWHCNYTEGNPLLYDVGEPYSMNPRAYEIAGCKVPQLYINARQEAHDIFDNNIWYCNYDNVIEGVENILNANEDDVLIKINNCFEIVKKDHLYIHRANKILNRIKEVEYECRK